MWHLNPFIHSLTSRKSLKSSNIYLPLTFLCLFQAIFCAIVANPRSNRPLLPQRRRSPPLPPRPLPPVTCPTTPAWRNAAPGGHREAQDRNSNSRGWCSNSKKVNIFANISLLPMCKMIQFGKLFCNTFGNFYTYVYKGIELCLDKVTFLLIQQTITKNCTCCKNLTDETLILAS